MPELGELIQTNSVSLLVGVVSAVVLGAVIGIIFALRQRVAARRRQEELLRIREVATIIENVRTTAAGRICWFLLGSTALLSCAGYYYADAVSQKTGLGVLLVVCLSIFGLGAALGRRRTYTVYQHRLTSRSPDQSRERTSEIRRDADASHAGQHPTR